VKANFGGDAAIDDPIGANVGMARLDREQRGRAMMLGGYQQHIGTGSTQGKALAPPQRARSRARRFRIQGIAPSRLGERDGGDQRSITNSFGP
jgi:hypothetical protein